MCKGFSVYVNDGCVHALYAVMCTSALLIGIDRGSEQNVPLNCVNYLSIKLENLVEYHSSNHQRVGKNLFTLLCCCFRFL